MTASAIDEAFASAWSVRHTMIVIFIFAFIADFLKCECQHSSLWPKLFYDGRHYPALLTPDTENAGNIIIGGLIGGLVLIVGLLLDIVHTMAEVFFLAL